MKNLRIVFFGTPAFAADILEELKRAHITPDLIVTSPDAPRGRKLVMTPPEAKVWAQENDIEVLQPQTLKLEKGADEARDILYNSEWDLFIVASYGKILPQALLDLPKHGTLNVHPSLLPAYRGPSPIRSAMLDDNKEAVGVSIMRLDASVDTGDIVAQGRVQIDEWPQATILEKLLAHEGGELLAEVIPLWVEGAITPEPQDHTKATHSQKLTKEMGALNLADDPYQNFLKIQALAGWPGTYFFVERQGKQIRVKITEASFKDGALTIERVIPEGKKEMAYQDFLRG
jgi:methionyl-tRNA formyltransferase